MLRPEELARPAAARTFTTELAWAGSPLCPRRLLLDGLIVIYHRRTFTGWTGSLMGCKRIPRISTNLSVCWLCYLLFNHRLRPRCCRRMVIVAGGGDFVAQGSLFFLPIKL